jgi:hypothetical protein
MSRSSLPNLTERRPKNGLPHTSAEGALETLAQHPCNVPDSLFKIEAAGYIPLR